ncbi:DNA-binding response regulator [Streptomyces sp. TRM76323]|uniref:DNA-binding response regulator n=1 Tax=Streptomyces tamarix TaxID=3078565 RepID=A0ABU3QV61_9ACTN|nr:DNA-binding response regulator [Streptomyces tamarix]MDT9686344.1 DNA-binding response regulator [Streptomyces tamarix]
MANVQGSVLGLVAAREGGREIAPARAAPPLAPRSPGQPVTGTRHICAALAALTESARRELLTFDDPAVGLRRPVPEPFQELAGACVRTAVERVRSVRQVVPRHALARLTAVDPGGVARLAGRARLTHTIPFKMIVVDRTVAAIPLDLELLCNGLLLIRDPVIVQALVRTHHAWWDAGEEIGEARQQGAALPPRLRPVLDALLAGLTDETAAARLGISARTYSRRVGELLAALGTTSRFRAGAEAARRGWL